MVYTAESYISAADVLSQRVDVFGPSQMLLKILGFEILLKAALRLENGRAINIDHEYPKGFDKLGSTIRAEILRLGNERFETFKTLNLDTVSPILKDLSRNFSKGRYEYEANQDLSDSAVREKETKWAEAGYPDGSADFRFHAEEMSALCFGLRNWIRSNLD